MVMVFPPFRGSWHIRLRSATGRADRPDRVPGIQRVKRVNLSWNGSPTATSYNVFRSARSSGPYIQIAVGVTQTVYSDLFVSGQTFYYVITSTDSSGNQSGEACSVNLQLPRRTKTHLSV